MMATTMDAYGRPAEFYVQWEDRAEMERQAALRGGVDDLDPALYWRCRDFRSEPAARRFQSLHPGSTVHQRFAMEEHAPGCWDWEERVLRD